MSVGFVGIGAMGDPMVRQLLGAGHAVQVHDVRREAAAGVCARGATWAASPRAVGNGAAVVFLSLPGPAEMEAVVLEPRQGLLAGMAADGVIVDTTTNAPSVTRRVAETCAARGVVLLDAPVSQKPPAMTMMVGGPADVFQAQQALLARVARHLFYVGPSGSGSAAKLVSQYLGYSNFMAAAEGLLIAAKAGVDLDVLARIIPVSAGASRMFEHFPRTVFNREFSSAGTLDIVAKDMRLACDLAAELSAPARIGGIVSEIMEQGRSQGLGGQGYANVVRVLEALAGAELAAGDAGHGGE
jgi:3-hydroxyisobutyrate dehydrogenase-like beta-hydroxyacid dehydrogenase